MNLEMQLDLISFELAGAYKRNDINEGTSILKQIPELLEIIEHVTTSVVINLAILNTLEESEDEIISTSKDDADFIYKDDDCLYRRLDLNIREEREKFLVFFYDCLNLIK